SDGAAVATGLCRIRACAQTQLRPFEALSTASIRRPLGRKPERPDPKYAVLRLDSGMTNLDATHDPRLRSWVGSAQGHADFPIQNLPFCVFSPRARRAKKNLVHAIKIRH